MIERNAEIIKRRKRGEGPLAISIAMNLKQSVVKFVLAANVAINGDMYPKIGREMQPRSKGRYAGTKDHREANREKLRAGRSTGVWLQ